MAARKRPAIVPQAVGRVYLLKARDRPLVVFASLAGAAAEAARITNELRRDMLRDNMFGVEESDIPLASPGSFMQVLAVLDEKFGYGNAHIAITEIGVRE
jgi:hypothetical protein